MSIDKEELGHYLKNHTYTEAAKHFGTARSTIGRYVSKYGLDYITTKYGNIPLTKLQINILLGSLLGDGHLRKGGRSHTNASTSQFELKQKEAQKEYITWIAEKMMPYISPKGIINSSNVVSGKRFYNYGIYTGFQPIFSEYVKQWYPETVKIIPRSLALNTEILAHWFVQDGVNHWSRRMASFATHCFDKDDVEFLISRLSDDLNIKSVLGKHKDQYIINVNPKEYYNFMDIVKPQIIWKCFAYKSDISKVNKPKPNYGANRLDTQKVLKIRKLFSTNKYTQVKLSKMFDVTPSTIGRIIHNITYPNRPHFGGKAQISTIYNLS